MPLPLSDKDIEKYLDDLDLRRLEEDRQVSDMEGWKESGGRKWTFRRPKHVETK